MKAKLKLVVVMLLALTSLQCHAASDGLYYRIISEADRTASVWGSSNISGAIEIPQTTIIESKTYTVTAVSDEGFRNRSGLTSITIPNSVKTIGHAAFQGCSGLTSVTIGNSVETIEGMAFYNCSGLTSITIPNSVKTIGSYAFHGCSGLTSVTIGNSVETISDYPIDDNLTFRGCDNLTDINVNSGNAHYSSINGVLYDKNASTLIFCPVKKTSLTIPNSVETIGWMAFYNCSGLTSITIPNSVKTIEDGAFQKCSGLISVTIGNSVETIEDRAFVSCLKLETIYMQCEVPIECKPNFCDDNLKNTILYIPKGTLAAYKKTTPWRDFWNIVEMDFSGVDEVAEDGGDAVRVENGRIVTDGDALTEVLDLQGRTVYRGYDRVVDNLARGLYVVRSGNNTVKIKL